MILILIPSIVLAHYLPFQKTGKCLNAEDFKRVAAYIKENKIPVSYEKEIEVVSFDKWDISIDDTNTRVSFRDKKGWTIFTVWSSKNGKIYLGTLSKIYQPEKEKKYHQVWCDFVTRTKNSKGSR